MTLTRLNIILRSPELTAHHLNTVKHTAFETEFVVIAGDHGELPLQPDPVLLEDQIDEEEPREAVHLRQRLPLQPESDHIALENQ